MTAPSDPTALVAELDREVEREAERIAESVLRRAPIFLEKVADDFYEMLLREVQTYLRENAASNIQSELSSLRASLQAERERSAQQAATIEAVTKHARALSDALIKVRPLGGSELFSRVGEEFYADPKFCGDEIEKLQARLHEKFHEVATLKHDPLFKLKEGMRERAEAAEARATAAEAERGRLARTIGHRDRRIARLVEAMEFARSKGVVFPADSEPPVVLSDAARAALSTAKERGE